MSKANSRPPSAGPAACPRLLAAFRKPSAAPVCCFCPLDTSAVRFGVISAIPSASSPTMVKTNEELSCEQQHCQINSHQNKSQRNLVARAHPRCEITDSPALKYRHHGTADHEDGSDPGGPVPQHLPCVEREGSLKHRQPELCRHRQGQKRPELHTQATPAIGNLLLRRDRGDRR